MRDVREQDALLYGIKLHDGRGHVVPDRTLYVVPYKETKDPI